MQGEMYNKWKKKTRREISAPGGGNDGDGDSGGRGGGSYGSRPNPNFKVNSKVPNELQTAEQIRKSRVYKDNMKNKNMSKDKRTNLEGLARKKKSAAR